MLSVSAYFGDDSYQSKRFFRWNKHPSVGVMIFPFQWFDRYFSCELNTLFASCNLNFEETQNVYRHAYIFPVEIQFKFKLKRHREPKRVKKEKKESHFIENILVLKTLNGTNAQFLYLTWKIALKIHQNESSLIVLLRRMHAQPNLFIERHHFSRVNCEPIRCDKHR